MEKERKDLEQQIKDSRDTLNDPEEELLSIEQFLNLAKNAGSKVKAADEVGKDHICRIIFLNLVVDEEKVVSYQMTKAFSKLEKAQNVLNGRSKANNFEPYILSLLYALNKMWDTTKYERETAPIAATIDEVEGSNQIKGKIYAY